MNTIVCGGAQVDPLTDEANCGACGRTCPTGGRCVDGDCFCPAGTSRCPGIDRCVDLLTDPANCAACGNRCGPGQTCANGRCQTVACGGVETSGVCAETPSGIGCSGTNPDCICATGADGGTACVIPDPVSFFPCRTNADCIAQCGCAGDGPFACIACDDGTRFCAAFCPT